MDQARCPDRQNWVAYLSGRLERESADRLAQHLKQCPDCERQLRSLERAAETVLPDNSSQSACDDTPSAPLDSGHRLIQSVLDPEPDRPAYDEKSDSPADDQSPFPWKLGHYEIVGELGHGGMGTVYLARDTQLGRQVALKVPRAWRTEDPGIRERLIREARAAAGLRHANICPIYEVGKAGGQPFIAMAYIQGQTLRDWARGG